MNNPGLDELGVTQQSIGPLQQRIWPDSFGNALGDILGSDKLRFAMLADDALF